MRGTPTPQIRAPLFPLASRVSSVPLCLAVIASIGSIETRGALSYVLSAAAPVLAIAGLRRAWDAAQRETERLR
jgi:hypothetical protein